MPPRIADVSVPPLTAASVLLVILAAGCSLETSPLVEPDGGVRDSATADGALDSSTSDTAPQDTTPGDAGPVDTGMLDVGPTDSGDTSLPDTSMDASTDTGPVDTGVDTSAPPTCDELYGGAPDYIYCRETAMECEFYTALELTRSCTDTCASLGGSCIRQYRNLNGVDEECVRDGVTDRSCDDTGLNDDICVCSR